MKRLDLGLEFLSDLVFGLALYIGGFSLESNPPVTNHELYHDGGTSFNFIVLISIWLEYTRITSVLHVETRGTILRNGVLHFTVALSHLFSTFNVQSIRLLSSKVPC